MLLVDLQTHIAVVKQLAGRACADAAPGRRTDLRHPPEVTLKAMLLCALYGLKSESRFCEALGDNLMFQWFIDVDSASRPPSPEAVASDCTRLLEDGTARTFFERVVALARVDGWRLDAE